MPAGFSPHDCTLIKGHSVKPWRFPSRGRGGSMVLFVPAGEVSEMTRLPRCAAEMDRTTWTCSRKSMELALDWHPSVEISRERRPFRMFLKRLKILWKTLLINQSINRPIEQSLAQWLSQSTTEANQSINWSINQPINNSINKSMIGRLDQPTDQSITQSTNQSLAQWVNQSINKPINQSINQSKTPSTIGPINHSINQSMECEKVDEIAPAHQID